MSAQQLQRWSREVAEDPGAPSFVRLARAYRRQGRRSVAREVILRGLERRPEHLAAHSLLAMIHVEEGNHERARDEWQTVLRLEPDHFDAALGLGLLHLEQNDLDHARRYLGMAARARPGDPTVEDALDLVEQRTAARDAPDHHGAPPASEDGTGTASGTPAPAARAPSPTGSRRVQPGTLFEPLMTEPSFLGGLLLDAHGLVVGGSIEGRDHQVQEMLGGLLHAAVGEAHRTAELIHLGDWRELLVEAEEVMLHLSPLPGGAVVVFAARPGTQAGWVMRLAGRARDLARRFLEVTA